MSQETHLTLQKLAFAGLIISTLMCLTGIASPAWLVLDSVTSQSGSVSSKTQLGVWYACITVEEPHDDLSNCYSFATGSTYYNDYGVKFWVARAASSINVLLSLVCTVTVLCTLRQGRKGKSTITGVITLVAAAFGIVASAVFGTLADDSILSLISGLGWSFIVYVVGVSIEAVVSIILLVVNPVGAGGGMVLGQANANPNVIVVSNQNQQMSSFGNNQMPPLGSMQMTPFGYNEMQPYGRWQPSPYYHNQVPSPDYDENSLSMPGSNQKSTPKYSQESMSQNY